jgi:hypothetical protein
VWLFDLWKYQWQFAKKNPSTKIFWSYTEISERCQKCLAEKIYACVQIHKVTLTVHCTYTVHFEISESGSGLVYSIIFWKEFHVDVWCMGTLTKEGVKNSARAPKLSVYGSVWGPADGSCRVKRCGDGSETGCVKVWTTINPPKVEFFDEFQTKVLRVFLLVIHSLFYSFALRYLFLQNSRNLLKFL